MPAINYSNDVVAYIYPVIDSAMALPDSPYRQIIDGLELSDFDQKILTYIEVTRAFMAEITSDVEARRFRIASAKMMAAMSESPGTYASVVVPPFVGTPNLAALTNSDQMTIYGISSYTDYFRFDIIYDLDDLDELADGPVSPPTTLDELIDILNNLIEVQGGDGYNNFFEFYNAGNGLIGLRLGDAAIPRGMNLMISDSGGGRATSLLTKLGMVAGSSDNAIRVRANDAVQRALAPFLTTLRYLPPGDGEF